MPSHLEPRLLPDGVAEGADDHGDFHGYCVGRNVGLGLDIPKGAFVRLEGLHYVDDLMEAVCPADDKEGQDGLGVWVGLVPDPIGDQDAVEPVVGLHVEGGVRVLGRLGVARFGHGGIMAEECRGRKDLLCIMVRQYQVFHNHLP